VHMPEGTPEPVPGVVAPGDPDPPATDALDPLRDEAFDRALSAFERGQEFELEAFLEGREELRVVVEESVQLAREVAVHAPRTANPPREVAGYEIERELGAGSMGTVFLARQRSLGGRRVALKVLPPSLGLSGRSKARFLAEARALAKLDHPGIVGVHEVIDQDGIVAFAMDWVPGGSLARVLSAWRGQTERDELEVLAECLGVERAELAAANAVTWILLAFTRLARALGAVHRKGLLHRDIKPGNILVRGDGELLLSDFGLVRDSEASLHTRTGAYVGTLAYSSPEQLRGEQDAVDARSDLYSFGVTLYEALTMRLPYAARTLTEVQRRAESGLFDPPRRKGARLPRDLETILGKTLDPDPLRRYANAEELADDLERLLSFRPILARSAGAWTRAARFLRRNRPAVVASSLVTLMIVPAAVEGSRWWIRRQGADDNARTAFKAAEVVLLEPRTADRAQKTPEALEEAMRWFDAALAFRPNAELARSIEVERAVIGLAIELLGGSARPTLPESIAEYSVTVGAFQGWKVGARPTTAELEAADPTDRRLYGLLALMMGEPERAFEAWRHITGGFPNDALANALEGEYLREQGKYERAYPLLYAALLYFDHAKFLFERMADVAVGTDRASIAADLLKDAENLPGPGDPYETSKRVAADICALRGQDREARDLYQLMLANHQGRIARYHFSQFLELRGHQMEALWLLDCSLDHEFVRLADEWWNSGAEPTWQKLERCLSDSELPVGSFAAFVGRYRAARERVQQGSTAGTLVFSPFTGLLSKGRAVLEPRKPSLLELAQQDSFVHMDLRVWRQMPFVWRCLDAVRFATRLPGSIELLMRMSERLLAAGQRALCEDSDARSPESPGWPSNHGIADNRRRAPGTVLALAPSQIWSKPCRGTPTAGEGIVVFQESNEDLDDLVGMYSHAAVVALDLASGAERWRVITTASCKSPLPAPSIVGSRVFLSSSRQTLSAWVAPARTQRVECRRLDSGELLWTWDSATDGGISALQGFEDGEGRAWLLVARSDFQIERLGKSLPSDAYLTLLDARGTNALAADRGWERGPWPTRCEVSLPSPVVRLRGGASEVLWVAPSANGGAGASAPNGICRWPIVAGTELGEASLGPVGDEVSPGAAGPTCVLDGARDRLFVLARSGVKAFDLRSGQPLWPESLLPNSADSSCTVLDDGRLVIVDPAVPQLTFLDEGGAPHVLELGARPLPKGHFEADGGEFWFATSDGHVSRIGADGKLELVAEVQGVSELLAVGDTWLARTGDRLTAYR